MLLVCVEFYFHFHRKFYNRDILNFLPVVNIRKHSSVSKWISEMCCRGDVDLINLVERRVLNDVSDLVSL